MAMLAFSDHKDHGAFPITDEQGQLIGSTTRASFTLKFATSDAAGTLLAEGRKKPLGAWEAQDAAGQAIVTMRGTRKNTDVEFPARGLTGLLTAPRIGKEWQLTGADGRVLLSSVPAESAGVFRDRDSWVVQTDGTLSLPELVAAVELHRLKVKADRNTN